MKTYKVWVRYWLEEFDDEADTYKNCYIDDEGVQYFDDSNAIDEFAAFESEDPQEAQCWIRDNALEVIP